MSVDIRLEFTPNPNALKYVVDEHVFLERGTANFTEKSKAASASPLAKHLLDIPGVASCLIGRNYVTVTKTDEGDWEFLDDRTRSAIKDHIAGGGPAVNPLSLDAASQPWLTIASVVGIVPLIVSSFFCLRALLLGEEFEIGRAHV